MRLPHGLSWVEFAASLAFYRLSCLGEEKKLTIYGHKTHLNSLSLRERAGVRAKANSLSLRERAGVRAKANSLSLRERAGVRAKVNSLSHWERAGVRVHRRRKKANNSLKIRVSQLNTRYLPIPAANRYHTR